MHLDTIDLVYVHFVALDGIYRIQNGKMIETWQIICPQPMVKNRIHYL